jgi:hypothetical protein
MEKAWERLGEMSAPPVAAEQMKHISSPLYSFIISLFTFFFLSFCDVLLLETFFFYTENIERCRDDGIIYRGSWEGIYKELNIRSSNMYIFHGIIYSVPQRYYLKGFKVIS